MKVVFCCPTITRPLQVFLDAVEASVPCLDEAGIDHKIVFEVGNPYISGARAAMLRKAMDTLPDAVVFLDHDLSWNPKDLLTLVEAPGDVVCGTYRFKKDEEEYMGQLCTMPNGEPACRADGAIKTSRMPAGFLKVTADAIGVFMQQYPELVYGRPWHPHVDLFNHGAYEGLWYGEDYAFSRRWEKIGGEMWTIPNLNIHHHNEDKVWPGNLHQFLLRQPKLA
jgi:glycosyltransferase involved in cell wall biosynthesis